MFVERKRNGIAQGLTFYEHVPFLISTDKIHTERGEAMPTIKDELDWHIYFKKNNDGTDRSNPVEFNWTESGEPLTFRSAYPILKGILECSSDNVEIATKSEFSQGHRKKIFNNQQIEEIKQMYQNGISKNQIAKKFNCSEKTIRNYLKEV